MQLKFDSEGGKEFGKITEANVGPSFRDRARRRDPVRTDAFVTRSTGATPSLRAALTEQEARGLASVLENPLADPGERGRRAQRLPHARMIRSGRALLPACRPRDYPGAGSDLLPIRRPDCEPRVIVNIVLLMGALTMFNFVLTLPGIAGIILTIGLAVDASVLIYERLREELALGKSLKVAFQAAYDKAFSSIFDANVTTLITAAILFWKASGPVKGFAISLTLGILASLFTALIVGRNLFQLVCRQRQGEAHLDAAPDLVAQLQLPRQRLPRGDAFAGVDHRWGDRLCRSWRPELRRRF